MLSDEIVIDGEELIYVDESDAFKEALKTFMAKPTRISIRSDDFHEAYTNMEELGEGRFGNVFVCQTVDTQKKYAAKSVMIDSRSPHTRRPALEREIEMLNRLCHPCVVPLVDAFDRYKREIVMVMQLYSGGELYDRMLDRHYVITEQSAAMIIAQLCEAARYIHSQNIIHFDIKPENIMFKTKEGNEIVLIDFGLAQLYTPNMQVLAGTPEFLAPEVVQFETVCFRTDIWSVGVITYILKRASAQDCLDHPWLKWNSRVSRKPSTQMNRWRKQIAQRRWKRLINCLLAISRMRAVHHSENEKTVQSSSDDDCLIQTSESHQQLQVSAQSILLTA